MARKIRPMDDYGIGEESKLPPAGSADSKTPAGGPLSSMRPPPPPSGEIPMGYPVQMQPPRPPTKFPQIAAVLLIITALVLAVYAYSLLTIDTGDYTDEVSRSFQLYTDSDGTATIDGTVTDIDGNPIGGVFILIDPSGVNAPENELNTTTDAEGSYQLEDVPIGKQLIIVSKDNYTTIEHRIFVEADVSGSGSGDRIELTFVMEDGTGTKRTGNYEGELYNVIDAYLRICGALLIIAIVMVLIGAVLSLLKKRYYITVIGCIFGIIFGLFLIIGTILSIIALYLIVKSKTEFK